MSDKMYIVFVGAFDNDIDKHFVCMHVPLMDLCVLCKFLAELLVLFYMLHAIIETNTYMFILYGFCKIACEIIIHRIEEKK